MGASPTARSRTKKTREPGAFPCARPRDAKRSRKHFPTIYEEEGLSNIELRKTSPQNFSEQNKMVPKKQALFPRCRLATLTLVGASIRGSAIVTSCSGWSAPIVISIASSDAPEFVVDTRSPVDSSAGTFPGVCGLLALPTFYEPFGDNATA